MKEWPKLWKFWLMFPAVISLFWESQSKEKREKAKEEVREVWAYMDKNFWQKIWEKPPVEKKPEPLLELADFDVTMVDENGIGCGRTHSSVFESGKRGKLRPGTYKSICIESPSMDALKYANIGTYADLIKRYKVPIAGQAKTCNVNDTLDMSVNFDIGADKLEIGTIHFRWDCE